MGDYYILDGKTPVKCGLMEWAKWFGNNDRKVNHTVIGKITISTVFLGIDHSFGFEGEWLPILFQTMVFEGKMDGAIARYSSWEQAEEGHDRMVERVKQKNGSL